MKRLALALAAAALGTGCGSSSSPPPQQYGSVDLFWDFIRTAPAQAAPHTLVYDSAFQGGATGPCTESAVETVTVDTAAGEVTVDCVNGPANAQGVGIDGLPAGSNQFRVRGWRGAVLVYDSTFTRNVPANLLTDLYVDVDAMAAPLTLDVNLYNTGSAQYYATCADATPPYLGGLSATPPNLQWEIKDPVFKAVIDGGTVGCGSTLPAPILSSYLLDLDDFHIRVWGLRSEDDALFYDSCWQTLSHFAAQNLTLTAKTSPVPTCAAL
ncbi:MAG TPA: hypothetical protein VF875_15525 [Anaeromyxobacter sp.]